MTHSWTSSMSRSSRGFRMAACRRMLLAICWVVFEPDEAPSRVLLMRSIMDFFLAGGGGAVVVVVVVFVEAFLGDPSSDFCSPVLDRD